MLLLFVSPHDRGTKNDDVLRNSMTDSKVVGSSVRHDPALPDRSAFRKVVLAQPLYNPPEYVRINIDMGAPIVVHAFAWGIACPDLYPTLTLHGSNNPEFMRDHTVTIPARTSGTVFGNNTHQLANNATLLWQLHFNHTSGSSWTADDVKNNTMDLYYTRLTSNPRYSRLAADGSIVVEDCSALFTGHVAPVTDFTPNAFRYFAFTVSVGRAVVRQRYSKQHAWYQELQTATSWRS